MRIWLLNSLIEEIPGLEDDCKRDEDCNTDFNLECHNQLKKCKCTYGFFLDPKTFQCN